MSYSMKELLDKYIAELKKIYGTHLQEVILYGSYARGDFKDDSDIDIMILLDIMLMCGKVTHKKLKDNQLTIPCLFIAKVLNLQFDLDKLVYYTYSVDRVEMTNNFQ